jgi:phosphate starvation-inducible protein PhoH
MFYSFGRFFLELLRSNNYDSPMVQKCNAFIKQLQDEMEESVPSGLVEAQKILSGVDGIHFHEFTEKDVVRHPLVQRIVEAYKEKRDE